jgi:hypothetical protein
MMNDEEMANAGLSEPPRRHEEEGDGMRVAIAQVDGKWPNLALAKIVALHRALGDDIEWFAPLATYDHVYASKVFTDSPPDEYLPIDAHLGGSGCFRDQDRETTLAPDIERITPDWSLWPWWPHDMGYSTRGCVRKCPFCIVPTKEGKLRVVAEFGDLTTGRPTMILHDNNVTAAPIKHFRKFCADATAAGVEIDFRQGLDARLLTDEHAAIIARSKFSRRIHLSFDNLAEAEAITEAVTTMRAAGIHPSRLTFYVLTGFNSTFENDMERVDILRALGCDPFVMLYNRNTDWTLRRFARWVNNKVAFKAMTWEQFKVAKV